MEFFQLLIGICFIAIIFLLTKTSLFKSTKAKIVEPSRRHIKDVKPDEIIQIEWYRAKESLCRLRCVNNDPVTKKILLEIRWGNFKEGKCSEYEKVVFDYDSKELANFHLLNTYQEKPKPKAKDEDNEGKDDYDIASLQKKMNEAIDRDDFEMASELQKKIDKLTKK